MKIIRELLGKALRLYSAYKKLFFWNSLSILRKNRLIQSSYIWLVIVPVTAKLFSKLSDKFIFSIQGKQYVLDLVLPFSWKMFYFAAICFTMANIFFSLFSPKIFKENFDYGDFRNSGREIMHIGTYMKNPGNLEQMNEQHGNDLSRIFWNIFYSRKLENRPARIITFMFYIVGILIFTWVAIENLLWVMKEAL
ncbi:MAG: hypothetical protein ACRBEE_16195 [Arenicella sp.]